MSEEMIVQHCAPTLAGMKTGNLFSCPYQTKKELQDDIRHMNHLLGPKGVRVLLMRCMGGRALIYLYRPGHLRRDFSDKEAAALLSQYGYAAEYPGALPGPSCGQAQGKRGISPRDRPVSRLSAGGCQGVYRKQGGRL